MAEFTRRVIVSAIIEKDGKYLLTQQGDGNHKDLWAFPGGGLELYEGELISALKREVREEIGVEVEGETLLDAQVFLNPADKFQLVAIFFKCRLKTGEPKKTREIEDFKWMSLEELKAFPRKLLRPPTEWFDKLMVKKLDSRNSD